MLSAGAGTRMTAPQQDSSGPGMAVWLQRWQSEWGDAGEAAGEQAAGGGRCPAVGSACLQLPRWWQCLLPSWETRPEGRLGRPGQGETIREGPRQGVELQGQPSLSWEDERTGSDAQGGSATCELAKVAEHIDCMCSIFNEV